MKSLEQIIKESNEFLDSIKRENDSKLLSITSVLDEKKVKYTVEGYKIGIMLAPFCWTWFRVSCGMAFFDHTYSQNTGKSQKGLKHEMKKEAHLRRLGVTI